MAIHITATGAQEVGLNDAILIQVNKATTGTLTITAAGSTQYGTGSSTIGVVTDPTVGLQLRYGGLRTQGIISVNPSATTDITVTALQRA